MEVKFLLIQSGGDLAIVDRDDHVKKDHFSGEFTELPGEASFWVEALFESVPGAVIQQ